MRMEACPPGSKVLCVGNGPILLIAAKRAALEGYDVSVVSGASTDSYNNLLYEPGAEPLPNLKLLETITGTPKIEAAFDELLNTCSGIMVAIDGDEPISDGLLDVVLPETTTVKRVVALSRNLNGKGLGPFVQASKGAANREVWAGGNALVGEYRRMEAKIKGLCERSGAEWVFVRAGTLKGGGPASLDDETCAETARLGLSYSFYGMGQQDLVNWRLLFDSQCQGVELTKGDVVEGPGLKGVFAATAITGDTKGDSSRHGAGSAMALALGELLPEGNADFGVGTKESRTPPTSLEWELEFSKLN